MVTVRLAALLLTATIAPAQSMSCVATIDGVMDLNARFRFHVEHQLTIDIPDYTVLTVIEIGDGTNWWSYILPTAPVVFRDGFVERVAPQYAAQFNIPSRLIPPGVWYLRVGTALGYSDTLQLRFY